MKKILAVLIVAVMTVALCVSASATLNIDRIHVNNNILDESPDIKDKNPIEISKGDKLYTIGWAYSTTALKKIVYSIDEGSDVECPDNYKDRADLVTAFGEGVVPNEGAHAGFGSNNTDDGKLGMFELAGIENLNVGEYTLTITAVYEDDSTESRSFPLNVLAAGDTTTTQAPETEASETIDESKPASISVDLSESTGSGVEVEIKDGKVVATTNGADPWVSVPLDNIDTSVYKYFTIKYTATKEIGSNNTYLMDTEKNPTYSGMTGTWTPNGMAGTGDGEVHTKEYNIAKDFPEMAGTVLTGVRFTACTETDAGGVFTIESVIFSQAPLKEGDKPEQQEPTTSPKTSDAAVIAVAAVAVVALAGVVVAKKVK